MRPDSTAGPERSKDDPDAEQGPPEAELDLAAAGEEPSPAAVVLTHRDPT